MRLAGNERTSMHQAQHEVTAPAGDQLLPVIKAIVLAIQKTIEYINLSISSVGCEDPIAFSVAGGLKTKRHR